jgi:hypothetical protein
MACFDASLEHLLQFAVGASQDAVCDIVKRYRNHQALAVAEYDELAKIPSVGADAAMLIRIAYSLSVRAEIESELSHSKLVADIQIENIEKAISRVEIAEAEAEAEAEKSSSLDEEPLEIPDINNGTY